MRKINLYSKHLARVGLDLSDRSKRVPVLGITLTILGLTLVAIVLASYFDSVSKLATINGETNNQFETSDSKPHSSLSPEETDSIQKSVNQLAIPWGTLFSAMEAISTDKVVLISLEPDADKRSVRIIAEAPDVYEMLKYIRALSSQPQIDKVYLVNQKTGDDQQDQPVRFTLEGYWARP